MIIVSQDKDAIINFDNIANLVVIENNIVSICNVEETTGITIAEYKNEERAKEILQEIVGLYRRCQQVIGERGGVANFIYPPKVYEMPKE